jgi:rubredoxin
MANKQLCPRCGSTKIVEYDTTFECRECNLEFKKENSIDLEDEDVLSVQEMKGILDTLGLKQDSNKLTKLKDMLDMDESFDHNKHKN